MALSGIPAALSITSSALPAGAATESTLFDVKSDLDKFSFLATRLLVDGSGVTQPISVSSLPLPAGASTSANQLTANASLSSLDSKFSSLGQKVSASSVPVVIASDQSPLTANVSFGDVSTGNTTAASLGPNAVFTGAWEDVSPYGVVSFSLFSDQASATNGLSVQWSSDGSNIDVSDDTTVTGGGGRAFALSLRAKFFRIVYTNGAIAQGVFRLTTVYHTTGAGLISRPLNKSLDDNNYAQTVRAVMSGKLPSGFYQSASIGQTTMANSVGVVLASDQTAIPVGQSGVWTTARSWTLGSGTDSISAVQSGNWSVRLQDGAGTALTSSLVNTRQALDIHQADTTFIVSGLTAVGAAPSLNPVSVSGVDAGGLKRHLRTDSSGNVNVVGPIANGSAADPNPVIVGGRDDNGNAMTQDGSLVLSKHGLFVHALPYQADFTDDGFYFNTITEFSLPSNGTETPIMLIKNPTGTAKKVFIDDIQCDVVTKGAQATFRVYYDPTVTANGSAVAATSTNIGGGTAASVMQVFSGTTTSSNGTKLRVFSVGSNSNSNATPINLGIEIQPNHTIIITGTPTVNATSVAVSTRWVETA